MHLILGGTYSIHDIIDDSLDWQVLVDPFHAHQDGL